MITQYHNETVITASSLYLDEPMGYGLMSQSSYKLGVYRKRFRLVRKGGGKGRPALVAWDSLPEQLQKKIESILGTSPAKVIRRNLVKDNLRYDEAAVRFYENYRMSDGRPLPASNVRTYIADVEILNAITTLVSNTKSVNGKITQLWKNLPDAIDELDGMKYPHDLPTNWRSLQRKWKQYIKSENPESYDRVGYESLIHAGFCNDNSSKLKGEVAKWWLAMYAQPNKMTIPMIMAHYEIKRKLEKWPSLTEQAVHKFLYEPENERQWTLPRHGKEEFNRKFTHHLSRKKENWFPNACWVIDGSKLDWIHYEDNKIKAAAKLKIDPVIDLHSEKIIGWSLSESESHADHFAALKMAANHAGVKPYYLTYDNQSGHKMKAMQKLYDGLIAKGGTHHPHRAYAHNSPAEGIFGRLQKQVANQWWFSDKQSPMSRDINNKPNLEFIKENKHLLKSKEDLRRVWAITVEQWNNAKHPRFKDKTRSQVYDEAMPAKQVIGIADIIEMFWVVTTRQIMYRKGGLTMRVGDSSFEYEVYDADNKVDVDFRYRNVGKKFFVRYDPEFMSDYVQLLEQDDKGMMTVVAHAAPKRSHEIVPMLMEEGDKAAWQEDYKVRDAELEKAKSDHERLKRETGISAESLIDDQEFLMKMGGMLPKEERSEVEENAAIMGF